MNAVRHGLLTAEVLVKGEDEEDLVSFRKRLVTALAPLGELETLLAERVVSSAWRLRRCLRVESEVFDQNMKERITVYDSGEGCGLAFIRDGNGSGSFATLSRYEAGIERSLFRALHELQRVQAAREGRPAPLPLAVDVDLAVSGPELHEPEEAHFEAEEVAAEVV